MVTVAPDSAASMHGPNPASYWRSSSWADSGPVKATLETWPSFIRVTETSAAPVIVCLASSATRPRVSDNCCSLSMILLSSAKAARGSSGGSAPPVWGVDMGGSRSGGGLRGRPRDSPGRRRRRPLTSEEPGREPADALLHPPEAGRRKRRQLAACVGPTDRGRRYSPIRCPGLTATVATAPTAASAQRQWPQPGRGPPEPGDSGPRRYASGSGGAVEGLGRAETTDGSPAGGFGAGLAAPVVLDAETSPKEPRCTPQPPPPAGSPWWPGGWPT